MKLRLASNDDDDALAAIYAPYVLDTVITFETVPPTPSDFRARLADVSQRFPWIVAEVDGQVVGYAYANRLRPRAAYDWSVETSIYLSFNHRGRGLGKQLYGKLFQILQAQGVVLLAALVTLPNPPSVAFHERFGFRLSGNWPLSGFKLGDWHDVGWFVRHLQERPIRPALLRPIGELAATGQLDVLFATPVPAELITPVSLCNSVLDGSTTSAIR